MPPEQKNPKKVRKFPEKPLTKEKIYAIIVNCIIIAELAVSDSSVRLISDYIFIYFRGVQKAFRSTGGGQIFEWSDRIHGQCKRAETRPKHTYELLQGAV